MQTKEKKWLEVEALLIPIYEDFPCLMDAMHDLKMETVEMFRISSVVAMN
jgi:hypothetical protein